MPPNRGTLTINSGNITGAIGNNDNFLSEVNINSIGNITLDSEINANNLNINSRGNIILNGDVNTIKLDINGIGNIIFYEEVKATNFNINNVDANVTVSRLLTGDILYNANSELVVNGVIGSITTSANNQGKLTINSVNVSGTIGDSKNSLRVVNIGANPVTFSANVFVPVILTEQASSLTLAKGVKLTGSVSTRNGMQGVLILEQDSSVTNGIGANGASLKKVEIGAGAYSLGGEVYAGTVVLTDKTSVLKLEHQSIIHGNITTTAGDGTVEGATGAGGGGSFRGSNI